MAASSLLAPPPHRSRRHNKLLLEGRPGVAAVAEAADPTLTPTPGPGPAQQQQLHWSDPLGQLGQHPSPGCVAELYPATEMAARPGCDPLTPYNDFDIISGTISPRPLPPCMTPP